MRKAWAIPAVVLLIGTLAWLSGCAGGESRQASDRMAVHMPAHRFGDSVGLTEHRQALQQFVEQELSGPYGIYTNRIDTEQTSETAASGHETLSESSGLLMRYYALTGQQSAFDQAWTIAKTTFDRNTGFGYRYNPRQDRLYEVNAAVDDLRIIRALREAELQFQEPAYGREADAYGRRLYAYNVQEGRLYDFYDEPYGKTNDFLTLCYADFAALRALGLTDREAREMEKQLLDIVRGGYLSDAFPFYETRYVYSTGRYEDRSGEIHTVESLLTILALAEIGQARDESVSFLKEKVAQGLLVGKYTRTGEPATDVQSTAIYAIAAMIGAALQDETLYKESMDQMERFRIVDTSSPLAGGYADANTGQAYSFDNLTALLAYAL